MEKLRDMILLCIYIMANYNYMLLHTITLFSMQGCPITVHRGTNGKV